MHYQDGSIINGCVGAIADKINLKSILTERNAKMGFLYVGVCVDKNNESNTTAETFYDLKDFYAFKLINNTPIDIRDNLLKELNLNY